MNNAESKKREELHARRSVNYLHKGKILTIRQDHLEYEGKKQSFEIIEHPGAVAILPILEKQILLVSQWRRASGKILLEIPAGTLEPKETPHLCAQRELQEEIGYFAHSLSHFGGFYTAPGFCTEYIHLFLATNLEPKRLEVDEDEGIDVVSISLKEALSLIEENKICDAKTILAIYKYAMGKKNSEN